MAIRPVPAILLGLAGALVLAGCDEQRTGAGSMGAANASPVAVSTAVPLRTLAQTPFERLWTLDLPGPVHACWQSSQVPGLLVFQLESREMVAVDAMSGHTRWVSQPLPALVTLPPHLTRVLVPGRQANEFANDDRIYLVSQDTLFCFDLSSGQIAWRWELPFSPSTGPCAVGSDASLKVFMGDWRGYLRVVSFHPEKRIPFVAWQWNLGATVLGTPVEREEQITFGDLKGRVHSFKLDREQGWEFAAGGPVAATTAPRDRLLFVGNDDHVFFALNRLTGERLGQLNFQGPIKRQPLVFDNEPERVFVWIEREGSAPGGLAAVYAKHDFVPWVNDPQKQAREVVRLAVEWFIPDVSALVASTPQYLYLTRTDAPQRMLAVDRVNGRVDWTADLVAESAPGKDGKIGNGVPVFIASYHDRRDLTRSFIVGDAKGRVTCHRFFGYLPDRADGVAPVPAAEVKAPKPKKDKADKADKADAPK
jgi:outer membrane protein assembly factor BamB